MRTQSNWSQINISLFIDEAALNHQKSNQLSQTDQKVIHTMQVTYIHINLSALTLTYLLHSCTKYQHTTNIQGDTCNFSQI